jgi:hypothetical protein
VGQESQEKAVSLAKDIALLNNVDKSLPGAEMLTAIDSEGRDLHEHLRMPRVRLTGGERKAIDKPVESADDKQRQVVHLIITLDR